MAEKPVRGSSGTTGRQQSRTRRKCPSSVASQIYQPGFITSVPDLPPKVFIKVRTGSLLAINQVFATSPSTHSCHLHPPPPSRTRVGVAGQATVPPRQRCGGRGKWDAVVILEETKGTDWMPLICSAQGEKRNVGSAAFIQPASELAGAGKNSP